MRLNEVTLERFLLTILLVAYHAFAIYCGKWDEPEGFQLVWGYDWFAWICYSFLLESFVLISGYIYAYQLKKNPTKGLLKNIVISKGKRLLIPSFFFSVLYLIIIKRTPFNWGDVVTCIFGIGHLWFLGMLFWVFVLSWVILKLHISRTLKFLILSVLAIVSYIPIPFNIYIALYYLLWFHIGYELYEYRNSLYTIIEYKHMYVWIVFAVVFVVIKPYNLYFAEQTATSDVLMKAVYLSLRQITRILYAFAGSISLFVSCVLITKRIVNLPSLVSFVSVNSMGVYVFQQFVLKYLYYQTEFPTIIGYYWLPIISFIIAFSLSLLLSVIVRRFTGNLFF